MSRWFRHYAGMARDDKLVRVAIRSKQTIERVVWIWGAILESAAEIDDNGKYDLDLDEAAYFLRADVSELDAIVGALESVGRISEGHVGKWNDRQYQSDRRGGTSRGSEAYVYCVGSTWDAAVKIGFSRNPWARAKELQTGNSAKVEVLAHFRATSSSEVDLHNLLSAHRHAGEWFNLPDKAAKLIQDAATASQTYEELVELLRRSLRRTTSSGPELETETDTETEETPIIPQGGRRGKILIPTDWKAPLVSELPPRSRACAEQWTDASYQTEAEGFLLYWRSERKMKLDWRDTWANRVIARHSAVMRDQKFGNAAPGSTKLTDKAQIAANKRSIAELYDRQGRRDEAQQLRREAAQLEQQQAA